MKDLYKILGVGRDAGDDEIKAAYREACKRHHPDRGGDAAAFRDVKDAYETLSDPDRRAEYDRTGSTADPTIDQQRAVMNLMTTLAAAAGGALDMDRQDLVEIAKAKLTEALRKCVGDGMAAASEAEKFRRAAQRFEVVGLDENLGRRAMSDLADQQDRKLAQIQAEERGLKGALELLSHLRYNVAKGADRSVGNGAPWLQQGGIFSRYT